jgi:hypothetical protein
MDPLVTTFTACRLAVEFRARGRRVLLFDGVGQPWLLRQLLAIEGEPERTVGRGDPLPLHKRALTLWSTEDGTGGSPSGDASVPASLLSAEAEADVVVVLLPGQSLATYLDRYSNPRQEFLVVTETSQEEVGRTFARLREIHCCLPGARLGVVVAGADRAEAEPCFDRLARAAARLLRVSLLSYGYVFLGRRNAREMAAGRPLHEVEEARVRSQMAAVAGLLLADGRPVPQAPWHGGFFDAVGREPLALAGGDSP